jgi:serine/threonine-protein kinase
MHRSKKERRLCILTEFPPTVVEALRCCLLRNDYVMMEHLGKGSFSMIYHVFSPRHGRDFAAKITDTASTRHRTACTAAAREEDALRRLSHPNIIKLYDRLQHDTFQILILELCAPTTLRSLIQTSHPHPVPRLLAMIGQLCSAVAYMHSRGVVHRDLKPSNILLGERDRPIVADFGMAEMFIQGQLATNFVGSAQYCAPEIFRGVPYDPAKADVWALGVTFYEMAMGLIQTKGDRDLLGRSIISGGLLIALETPPLIRRIVGRMTEMSPARRPDAATVLAISDIQAAMSNEGGDAPVWRTLQGPSAPMGLTMRGRIFVSPSDSFFRRRQRMSQQVSFGGVMSDTPDSVIAVTDPDVIMDEIE